MPWIIKKINNSTKEFHMVSPKGAVVKVTVPKEHHNDIASAAFVKAVQDGHDLATKKATRKQILKFAAMFIFVVTLSFIAGRA